MKTSNLIPLHDLCKHHQLEMTFFNSLSDYGLISITTVEENYCIQQDHIADIEKMIRLHKDLNLNFEGIDTVLNMLEKIENLQLELNLAKNRLRRFEDY